MCHNGSNVCHDESNIYYGVRNACLDNRDVCHNDRETDVLSHKTNLIDDVQDCMSCKIQAEQLYMIFSVHAVIMINRLYAGDYCQEVTVH